jgi:hypothetical protein
MLGISRYIKQKIKDNNLIVTQADKGKQQLQYKNNMNIIQLPSYPITDLHFLTKTQPAIFKEP